MAPTTDEDVREALQALNDYRAASLLELHALNQAFMDEAAAIWKAANPKKRNKPKGWLKALPGYDALLAKHLPGFKLKSITHRKEVSRLKASLNDIVLASPMPERGDLWDGKVPVTTAVGIVSMVDGEAVVTLK